MAEYLIQDITLTEIANAIREKDGTTASIPVLDFESRIGAIETAVEPTIVVSDTGLITATAGNKTATHQLSSSDDGDFISANIVSGKTVFGLSGKASVKGTCKLTIKNTSEEADDVNCVYASSTANYDRIIEQGESASITIPQNSCVFVYNEYVQLDYVNPINCSVKTTETTMHNGFCVRVGAVSTASVSFYSF